MNKVLIIGATGRVASAIVKATLDEPSISLKLSSSRSDGVGALQDMYPTAEVVQADWTDRASLVSAFSCVQRVVMIPPDFLIDEEEVIPNIVAAYEANPGIQQFIRMLAIPDAQVKPEDLAPEFRATRSGEAMHVVGKSLLDASPLPMTYLNMVAWFTSNLPWFFAEDVRNRGEIRLPGDAPRRWISETDMAACFQKILCDPPQVHLGKVYRVMGPDTFGFADVARLIADEIGKPVSYVDTDEGLREAGEDLLITYIKHESKVWSKVSYENDFETLLGRMPTPLEEWIRVNRADFL